MSDEKPALRLQGYLNGVPVTWGDLNLAGSAHVNAYAAEALGKYGIGSASASGHLDGRPEKSGRHDSRRDGATNSERPAMLPYKVITWTNLGNRIEYETHTLADALKWAKSTRTVHNRTVKVAHCGDSIRHWSRTISAPRNHWATHSTAECSR